MEPVQSTSTSAPIPPEGVKADSTGSPDSSAKTTALAQQTLGALHHSGPIHDNPAVVALSKEINKQLQAGIAREHTGLGAGPQASTQSDSARSSTVSEASEKKGIEKIGEKLSQIGKKIREALTELKNTLHSQGSKIGAVLRFSNKVNDAAAACEEEIPLTNNGISDENDTDVTSMFCATMTDVAEGQKLLESAPSQETQEAKSTLTRIQEKLAGLAARAKERFGPNPPSTSMQATKAAQAYLKTTSIPLSDKVTKLQESIKNYKNDSNPDDLVISILTCTNTQTSDADTAEGTLHTTYNTLLLEATQILQNRSIS